MNLSTIPISWLFAVGFFFGLVVSFFTFSLVNEESASNTSSKLSKKSKSRLLNLLDNNSLYQLLQSNQIYENLLHSYSDLQLQINVAKSVDQFTLALQNFRNSFENVFVEYTYNSELAAIYSAYSDLINSLGVEIL